jgi:hypothetical protein
VLDVLLVGRGVGVERVDGVGADDLLRTARPFSARVCGVVVDWPGGAARRRAR